MLELVIYGPSWLDTQIASCIRVSVSCLVRCCRLLDIACPPCRWLRKLAMQLGLTMLVSLSGHTLWSFHCPKSEPGAFADPLKVQWFGVPFRDRKGPDADGWQASPGF